MSSIRQGNRIIARVATRKQYVPPALVDRDISTFTIAEVRQIIVAILRSLDVIDADGVIRNQTSR